MSAYQINKNILICFLVFLSSYTVMAQSYRNIKWNGIVTDNTFNHITKKYLRIKGASYDLTNSILPKVGLVYEFDEKYLVPSIKNYEIYTAELTGDEQKVIQSERNKISSRLNCTINAQIVNGKTVVVANLLPFIVESGVVKKIERIKIEFDKKDYPSGLRSSWKSNSELASGKWYKIAIANGGLVKLDYDLFKGLGLSSEEVNLSNLKVYTAEGGMLPEQNTIEPVDGLVQIPVMVYSAEDGSLGKNDFAVCFAPSPNSWKLNDDLFFYTPNIYSDSSYLFFSFDNVSGVKPITNEPSALPGLVINSFDDYSVHELEATNLISSGRTWFGENFNIRTSYVIDFEFPNILTSTPVDVRVSAAIRSINSSSTLSISAGSIGSATIDGDGVSGDYTADYAEYSSVLFSGKPSSSKISVLLNFTKAVNNAQAWLDRIIINCQRSLTFVEPQMQFRKKSTFNQSANYTYEIKTANSNAKIWNISDPLNPKNIEYTNVGQNAVFNTYQTNSSEFIVFDPLKIDAIESAKLIDNQNIHSISEDEIELLIISPKLFLGQAEELAEIHRNHDGLNSSVVDVNHIYNEFSGGRQDLSAIRNFLRFLKETNTSADKNLRYVLLFGDASYDFKDRITGNTNFIPIYQTAESLNPTKSIATDDFIGYLSPDYIGPITSGILEVGIGRLPVRNLRQASDAINKIRNYIAPESFGDWRNRLSFVADDEDSKIHMDQADELATRVDRAFPRFNVNKILSDAYPQRATPGGHRYPDVNSAIDNAIVRGSLTMNYLGHGGELGWAKERILEVSQINKWSNINNMPLLVTATCEFSRFDDPKRTSAGEFVFLNPDGGGIGLLTTTRLVFSSPNFDLAIKFNEVAYEEYNGEMPRLGDLSRLSKANQSSLNSRVFALLGDPALKLAYPQEKVVTTSISDTIRALDLITIEGQVVDRKTNELLSEYNGIVYPTVFDKEKELKTLNNDITNGVYEFKSRNSVLFRGKATVKSGKFSFSFVVPKDIDYNFGIGKISYYTDNGVIDGNGADTSVVVGGKNPNAVEDNIGPEIQLYMNDSTFVNGGITNKDPVIFAKLFDLNGINTTGSGVGHDITAIIDANTSNQIVLNEYYQTELNSYRKGTVSYQLKDLEEGSHTLKFKAWDVYNNSSEVDLNFVVTENEKIVLDHVLNYPNPFTTNTDFYLEHNQPSQSLFVRIQVFTISGKIVKTIDGWYNSKGFRLGPINWNGLDDFGDKIGKGVYVYKVSVKSPNGDVANKFEKLVILN